LGLDSLYRLRAKDLDWEVLGHQLTHVFKRALNNPGCPSLDQKITDGGCFNWPSEYLKPSSIG
jgi:hypothetical protein